MDDVEWLFTRDSKPAARLYARSDRAGAAEGEAGRDGRGLSGGPGRGQRRRAATRDERVQADRALATPGMGSSAHRPSVLAAGNRRRVVSRQEDSRPLRGTPSAARVV